MNRMRAGIIGVLVFGTAAMAAADQQHVLVTPDDLTWQDGPPSLPAGARFAVIEGDPKKEGLFTMRLKLPADRCPAGSGRRRSDELQR